MPSFVGRLVPLAVIAVFAGCSDPAGPATFPAARELWDSQSMSSYEYTMNRACFCGGPHGPVVVTVIDDRVVGVREQDSGLSVPTSGWPTVNELFAQAEAAHANGRLRSVAFHQSQGYPTSLEICCMEDDSGVRYGITNLHPIVILL